MPSVLALFAHPDDIEFVAAGTLALLGQRGWDIHLMNLANGCCGSTTTSREQTARIRLEEAKRAASHLRATHYDPIFDDLEIEYTQDAIKHLLGIIRRSKPTILLTHAPVDYMEDHMQTCRLAVTAAFAKGVPNYPDPSDPLYTQAFYSDIAIYHAQPHGNRTPLGQSVRPQLGVFVDSVMETKRAMLAEHRSQQQWLKESQGMNSYIQTMLDLGSEVADLMDASCAGTLPGKYAEGWTRHLHLGFSAKPVDPLKDALSDLAIEFPSS
ncbi:MAG: PIG-L deacetylase family protein [Pirellula sp.]